MQIFVLSDWGNVSIWESTMFVISLAVHVTTSAMSPTRKLILLVQVLWNELLNRFESLITILISFPLFSSPLNHILCILKASFSL